MNTIEIPVDVDKIDATKRLIQATAEYCGAEVTTSLIVKVETDHKGLVDLLRTLPAPTPKKQVPAVEYYGPVKITPMGLKMQKEYIEKAKKLTADENRSEPAAAPEVQKTDKGYCRNCGEPRLHGQFCSVSCRNQYYVKKSTLKHKGIKLDELISGSLSEGKRGYFTREEFDKALHDGKIPEGARMVTPEANLRKVVMQGGRLTFEEYFPDGVGIGHD